MAPAVSRWLVFLDPGFACILNYCLHLQIILDAHNYRIYNYSHGKAIDLG